MNTLFTRTLLWFLVTVILTFAAMILAAALDNEPEQRRRPPYGMLLMLQLTEARHAYEHGGPEELRAALDRFRRTTGFAGILTDADGRDLATGEDRSAWIRELGDRPGGPVFQGDRTVLGRRTRDGRYAFFLVFQRGNWFRWFLQPEVHLTMLAALTLFSFAFARHLTNPVRGLQKAVECFGRGDFQTRIRSTRKDEIGQLARAFDQMADRIQTLLSAERRLLLDISHELRSPLARLSVALELARSDESHDPKHFDRIQKETERLNALVGELLQVTRAEGDAARMRFEPLQLDAVIGHVVEDVQVEAVARGRAMTWSAGDPISLPGDAELLRRAVENILRNAIRYAPEGSTVAVSLRRSGNSAIVTVQDSGPGVPEEDTARIFDAFYRVESHRDRSSGGVGLGLSIARRAIELHRGRISARNLHPGLEVTIELPLPTAVA